MPVAQANGLDIFYDEIGDASASAVLLIMGLGTQMIAWSDDFRQRLASRGFRVVRFDNRDIGLSQKLDGAPIPSLPVAIAKAWLGLKVASPYSLTDMARDTVGLLDALGIDRAHVVGASMGGMIAQIMAAKQPERVRSLVSMMSTSGARRLPGPTRQARAALTARRPPGGDKETLVRFGMDVLKTIGSPGFPTPEADLRAFVEEAMRRSVYPQGFVRQFLAVLADGSRVELLKTIRVPTLVLHGEADPLIPVEGGRDTARHVPGAILETIAGWGHDLPAQLVPALADRIAAHCRAADAGQVYA